MKCCRNLLRGILAVVPIAALALFGCTPVERPAASVTAPPSVTVSPSVTVADPVWPPDVPEEGWWDIPETPEPDQPADMTAVEEAPFEPAVEEAPFEPAVEEAPIEQAVARPPAGFGKLVEVDLQLPDPAFRGTPVPVDEPNVEKPLGTPRPPFLAPEGTTNVALGRPVSASDPAPVAGELDYLTNGDKEASDFGYLELNPGTQWVQIDLGRRAVIFAVLLWHNHAEARVYRDVVVQISDCPDFLEAETIFNNDYNNTSGLGVGPDMGYVETAEGKLIDARGLEGRYVRLYSRGNHIDDKNHYTEVAVYGIPLDTSD